MTIIDAVILGIVEGLTEFLPISSTGHLVLTAHILKIEQSTFVKTFEIVIQFGAILSVLLLYFTYLKVHRSIWRKIFLAFLPSALIGFIFYKLIKSFLLGNETITLLSLLVGGIAIIFFERYYKKLDRAANIEAITDKQAIFIGLSQSVSLIPGVSRAAATILGGMAVGLTRKAAVEFSFLLAVPTMLGASAYDLYKASPLLEKEKFLVLALGFITSFLTALLVVRWFSKYVRSNSLVYFGIYRILLAIIYAFFFLR
jgi:undecaprenyl-diphosphatase